DPVNDRAGRDQQPQRVGMGLQPDGDSIPTDSCLCARALFRIGCPHSPPLANGSSEGKSAGKNWSMVDLSHRILAGFGLLFLVLILFACSAPVTESSPAAQLVRGEPIYRQTCATTQCHGTEGQGRKSGGQFAVWPLVGAEFQQRHPNAQVVF